MSHSTPRPKHSTAHGELPAEVFVVKAYASEPSLRVVQRLSGFEDCHVDETALVENGQRYYQVRIGFFRSRTRAEAALVQVRKHFAASFVEHYDKRPARQPPTPPTQPAALRTTPVSKPPAPARPNAARETPALRTDSTQTVRALTPRELADANQPKWHVVQLVVSERPINLDTMPRLDVFAAYRLYVVHGQQTPTRHALRLGFFSEESSAQMLCGYLKTFFASATVTRVSAAERDRFADQPPPGGRPAK